MISHLTFGLLLLATSANTALAIDCSRPAGSLPNSGAAMGTPNPDVPVEHIVVIMQENHSFDRYFGRLNSYGYYEGQIDGINPNLFNPDKSGHKIRPFHEKSLCTEDVDHGWNGMHVMWNGGRNDQFFLRNGKRALGYYEDGELPYYYALANNFAVADRYFSSVMTQTYPNRMYLLAATSFGHIRNDEPAGPNDYNQKTIFDLLDEAGVSWKYYPTEEDYLKLFGPMHRRDVAKIATAADFRKDLDAGKLPQVSIIESSEEQLQDEHPASNVQIGQAWVADKINALMASKYWPTAALFFTYDENGGFYDHVAPPEACAPDDFAPRLKPKDQPGMFDHYGFRVPFVLVSPFAKHHYVSHVTYDHTSILKFIETRFNLPALTRRDANADAMLDLFDFKHPEVKLPELPMAKLEKGARWKACLPKKQGRAI